MTVEFTATEQDEANALSNEGQALAEVLGRWNRTFWWAGVRPMMQRMVEADLTLAESVVLRSLRRGPLTVAQAGACLMLSHSAASRAVDSLVRDGYLTRVENPEDRRQKLLSLAPRGEELLGEMESIMVERMAGLVGVLDGDELAQFRALLERILTLHAQQHARDGNNPTDLKGPFVLEEESASITTPYDKR